MKAIKRQPPTNGILYLWGQQRVACTQRFPRVCSTDLPIAEYMEGYLGAL